MGKDCKDCLPCQQGLPCAGSAPRRIMNVRHFGSDCSADFMAFSQSQNKDWNTFAQLVNRCAYTEDNLHGDILSRLDSLSEKLRTQQIKYPAYLNQVEAELQRGGAVNTLKYVLPFVHEMRKREMLFSGAMALAAVGVSKMEDQIEFANAISLGLLLGAGINIYKAYH